MDAIGKHVLAKLEIAIRQKFGDDVNNFATHEDNGNYTVVMDIGEDAHVNCLIRPAYETMVLRSESTPKGVEVQELEEIGSGLTEKIEGSRMTAYDGTLAIQKAVSYADTPVADAERIIYNVVMEFIQVLIANRGMLSGREKGERVTDEPYTGTDEEDIFGFDDISEDEIQRLIEEKKSAENPADGLNHDEPEANIESTEEASPETATSEPSDEKEEVPRKAQQDRGRKKKNRKNRDRHKNNSPFMESMAAAVSGPLSPETEVPTGQEEDQTKNDPPEEEQGAYTGNTEAPDESKDLGSDTEKETGVPEDSFVDEALLDGLLKGFEEDDPIRPPATTEDIVSKSEEAPRVVQKDILDPGDDYHGSDPYGLVRGTREYKDTARELIGKLHDLLAGLYTPMYQTVTEIYERNEQLEKNERNIQIKMDALSDRQRDVDESESQVLASQQALLQERRKFSEYRESVRAIISDYDVQVHLVKEQDDEIKLLKHDLAQQTQEAERYRAKANELMEARETVRDPKEENQSALLAENKGMLAQIKALNEKVDNYHQIITVFKRCHKNWKERETEYQQRETNYQRREVEYQDQLKDARSATKTAKEKVDQLSRQLDVIRKQNDSLQGKLDEQAGDWKKRAEDAETRVQDWKKRAEDAETRALDWKEQAVDAKAKIRNLEQELKESREKADAMEQRIQEADEMATKAPEEMDVTKCASDIIDALSGIGIQAEPVPGAAEMMLEAKYKGHTIAVNVALSMLYVSKEVRKPARYSKKIDDLNKLDIRSSYNAGEKDITCRSAFRKPGDVADQVQEIMDNMKEFS